MGREGEQMSDAAAESAPDRARPRADEVDSAEEPRGREEASSSKRRRALLIVGGIAAVVLLGVLVYVLVHAGKESTDDAQVDADVVPLAPRVAGQVAAVLVAENQAVKKGDVVVQLDDRDYEATARGSLTQAEANLLGSSRSVSGSRAQLDQARASLASRQADLELADANLRRARELRKGDAIAAQQL